VLHNQLRMIYDLLLLAFGHSMLHESRSVNFAKFAPLIRSLVDTATLLAENNAAFLVQATEQVEVTDDMRSRFAALLRTSCASSSLITAAFLFVDTKLLTAYTRPKTTGVHPIDVFLLSIFLTSQLDPLLRDTSSSPVAALPVADYSDHSGGGAAAPAPSTASTTATESNSFANASTTAVPANTLPEPVISPRSTSVTSPATTRSEPTLSSVSDDGGVVVGGGTLSGLSLPAVEDTIAATTAFLSSAVNGFTGASDTTANDSSSNSTATSTSASRNASTSAAAPPTEAPLFKVLFLRPGDKPVSTARELAARRVYIARLMGKITFVAVLRDDSGAGSASAEEQRAALDAVRDELGRSLLKDYAEYLQMRAQVHVSMLNYVYDMPGLVHFIFVDRTAHRVLVPTVTPLHGQDCTVHTPESSARMTSVLRKEIWSMVNFAQSSLVRGSISTLVRRGAFLYSSRLWIEDGDGFELIVEHPLFSDAALVRDANSARVGDRTRHRLLNIDDGLGDDDRSVTTISSSSGGSGSGGGGGGGGGSGGGGGGANDDEWASSNSNTWGAEFYPALVQRLYPTQRYVRIYELYTLYIGMLTAQHIAVCDRKLLSSLQIAS
jgi:hypothetical protein